MGIGFKLKELMKQSGISTYELAKRVGVAPTTIYSMIQRDSKKADIELLVKIAQELGTTVEYFSNESDKEMDTEPTYEDLNKLIARNGKNLSSEEKLKLIKLLSEL